MNALIARLDALNETIGRTVSWLTLAMVLLTFLVAALRYLFAMGSIALQESILYLHALVFMLGAAYTLKQDEHVRVDIFYRPASPRAKAWIDLLGTLFLLFPVCLFLLWISWEYVAASWSIREGSRETGGLNLIWLLKAVIPVTALLLTLQGIAQIGHQLRRLLGHESLPPPHTDHPV